jgi:lipid-binding SYLF domain-containing protein
MARFTLAFALLAVTASGFPSLVSAGWDPEAVKKAEQAITEFLEADEGLQVFFDSAYAYAVFPSVGKGAIGIGGAYGTGTVFAGGKPVGETDLKQVTVGFQFGGQAYREVVFFEDKEAFENFQNGNMKLSAQASAVAATAGASADLGYKDGVAITTMAKGGLMYEASVGGQHFEYTPFEEKKKTEKSEKEEKPEEGEESEEETE